MILEEKISSILGGRSPSTYYGGEGQFDASIAIDPDFPISSSNVRTSGYAVPVAYTDFSGANLNSRPVAIINTPKNTNTYIVTANGRLISYNSSLASETLIDTVTGTNARGAAYYNNYIYIFGTGASKDDVSRYGPLNNSPSLTDNWWKGSLSLTALTDTTYPSLRGVPMPNHVGHVHGDGALYFTDFINGQGMLHKIQTSKTTNEGDTNNGSSYNVLDFPFGFYPTDLDSASTNIFVVGIASPDSGGDIVQGKSSFIVWDPTNTVTFFLGPVELEDPLATACKNVNGTIHIWSGNGANGVRVSRYLGGESTSDVAFLEEGAPPFPYAVDTIGNRVVWGGYVTYPASAAVVWALGSKDEQIAQAGLHCIARAASADMTNQNVVALKYVQQDSNIVPKLVIGWKDDSNQGLDKYSASGTLASRLRFVFNIGRKTKLNELVIPLAGAVDANTTITPTAYLDDASSSVALPIINNTNYPSSRQVRFSPTDLDGVIANNNIMIEFVWTGTTPIPIGFPLSYWLDTYDV